MHVSKAWRTFITALSEEGVSVRVIQEFARHRDLATTQRYIDMSVDELRNAVNLVGILSVVAQPVAHRPLSNISY